MRVIYDLGIFFYRLLILLFAFRGNKKAKKWIAGREEWANRLRDALTYSKKIAGQKTFWFHCSSLGEFEQGRPVIEQIRHDYPDAFILLSFFSPSGFEIRKNYEHVNHVCYLPADTKQNAKQFIEIVQPDIACFIKYDFWFHYLSTLKNRSVPIFFISSIFRSNQIFFKSYAGFFRRMLLTVSRFYVQNEFSAKLLLSIGLGNVTVTGDTRFDRVYSIAKQNSELRAIHEFSKNNFTLVGGSTWKEDETILFNLASKLPVHSKLILVPHEVNDKRIAALRESAMRYFKAEEISLYSNFNPNTVVLIIDTIGILSSIYQYANVAWIGGGFGKGIHNTLEAVAFGKPVVFGPNYKRFEEAVQLIQIRAGFTCNDFTSALPIVEKLAINDGFCQQAGLKGAEYVKNHTGATEKIVHSIKSYLG